MFNTLEEYMISIWGLAVKFLPIFQLTQQVPSLRAIFQIPLSQLLVCLTRHRVLGVLEPVYYCLCSWLSWRSVP